jgi:hypothetical protein
MVLSSRSRYCEKFAYSVLPLVRRYHGVYEREICKLYRKYIRVCSEQRLCDQLGRLLKDDLRSANGNTTLTNNGGSKTYHYDSYTFHVTKNAPLSTDNLLSR